MNKKNFVIKVCTAAAYVAMVVVNYLANALPIGGVTTGEASDAYTNLFTPAGITFSIWGLIYLLLFGYTLYQLGFWQKDRSPEKVSLLAKINSYFLITSLANIAWIFAWHYGVIWLSVLIMIALLIFLIKIADVVNKGKYSISDTIFVRLPFSIYFGWITVATIANVTATLVNYGWNGFGLSEQFWAVLVIAVGIIIAVSVLFSRNDIFYCLVVDWAILGILLKRLGDTSTPALSIIITTIVGIALITIGIMVQLIRRKQIY